MNRLQLYIQILDFGKSELWKRNWSTTTPFVHPHLITMHRCKYSMYKVKHSIFCQIHSQMFFESQNNPYNLSSQGQYLKGLELHLAFAHLRCGFVGAIYAPNAVGKSNSAKGWQCSNDSKCVSLIKISACLMMSINSKNIPRSNFGLPPLNLKCLLNKS